MIKELFGNLFGKKAREKDQIEKEEKERAKLEAEKSGETVEEKGIKKIFTKAWIKKQWDKTKKWFVKQWGKTKELSIKIFKKVKGWFKKNPKEEGLAEEEKTETVLTEVAIAQEALTGENTAEVARETSESITSDEDKA